MSGGWCVVLCAAVLLSPQSNPNPSRSLNDYGAQGMEKAVQQMDWIDLENVLTLLQPNGEPQGAAAEAERKEVCSCVGVPRLLTEIPLMCSIRSMMHLSFR